jgi:glycosyltransferase involved in cell wall biosynthesis
MPDQRVSFVIAVHNGARFLDQTLNSAAAQTHRPLEIVVVDDGSTDESAAVIDAWASRHDWVRPVRVAHAGPQRARNVGVAATRGDFIAFLDHDDIASPDRVATQLAWMQAHRVDVCGSCTQVFGDDSYFGWVPEHHDDILRESIFRCAFVHPTMLVPAAIARAHPFDPRHRCGGDELPVRLAIEHGYRLGNVPAPLVKYRHHQTQRTQLEARAIRAHRRILRRRVFFHLFSDATQEDADAVLHVTRTTAWPDASVRARAGAWMDRLSSTGDPMVRRLIAERWAHARDVLECPGA